MAQSPTHKFGQIIGDLLEEAMKARLEEVAREYGFYLDYKHTRTARGRKKKVAWLDNNCNCHDLDFVFEKDGSDERIGSPKAFIEIAWRRYTKHSRNKVQEIQGAIIPLVARYHDCCPFLGVVLAGEFTEGAIAQLRSIGFRVLHYHYESIVCAFETVGVDARFGEDTPDETVQGKVDDYNRLKSSDRNTLIEALQGIQSSDLDSFCQSIRRTFDRQISCIQVTPLHGDSHELCSVEEAVSFIRSYREEGSTSTFVRYELRVTYTNGDKVEGSFRDKDAAVEFLACVACPPACLRAGQCVRRQVARKRVGPASA